jgi:hypothetical protein
MTPTEKAIRDFCGHHADWWPSTTQVQKMLALAKLEQEPVAWIQKDMECDDFDPDSMTCEKPNIGADGWKWIPLYATPPAAQPAQERNFCERCGKRTADLTVIHTCTPPQEKNK